MDLGLQKKTAIVLASSKGIGRAIAEGLALEGANIVLASREEKNIEKAATEINENTKANVAFKTCDVRNEESIKSLVRFTIEQFGSVDILVNNSGGPPKGYFLDFTDQDWQDAFELNLLSYIRAIREVIPYMKEKGRGKIVNIASSSIKQPIHGLILSNTFRNGVIGLAKSLSTELGEHNILINTIGPGKVRTERLQNTESKIAIENNLTIDQVQEETLKTIPLGRYATPEEFAKTAVFLCSEANTYITGQAFLVDGGMVKSI